MEVRASPAERRSLGNMFLSSYFLSIFDIEKIPNGLPSRYAFENMKEGLERRTSFLARVRQSHDNNLDSGTAPVQV